MWVKMHIDAANLWLQAPWLSAHVDHMVPRLPQRREEKLLCCADPYSHQWRRARSWDETWRGARAAWLVQRGRPHRARQRWRILWCVGDSTPVPSVTEWAAAAALLPAEQLHCPSGKAIRPYLPRPDTRTTSNHAGQGSVDTFKVQAADVGSLQQLRIWVDAPVSYQTST